jgi:uncharacterized protein
MLYHKGSKHSLIVGKVTHKRFFPRSYQFSIPFYWPLFDYDHLRSEKNVLVPVRYEGCWPWSFWDRDHLQYIQGNLRDQLSFFLKKNLDQRPLLKILILAQPRMLGYVFNPVSFFFIQRSEGEKEEWSTVIQIGNTFNEIKPYAAGDLRLESDGSHSLSYESIKNFYISPFIALTNVMHFQIKMDNDSFDIKVSDYENKDHSACELVAHFSGKRIDLTWFHWLLMQVFVPWQTLVIIFLIHWHAFILWFKKIPYYQKKNVTSLESGVLKWKLSKRDRMNLPKV